MASKYNIVLGAKLNVAELETQLKSLNGRYTIDFGANKATANVKGLSEQIDVATKSTNSFAKSVKAGSDNTGLLNQNLTSAIGKFTA